MGVAGFERRVCMKKLIVWGILVVMIAGMFPVKAVYAEDEHLPGCDKGLYKLVGVPVNAVSFVGWSNNDYVIIGVGASSVNGKSYYTPIVYRVEDKGYMNGAFLDDGATIDGKSVTSWAHLTENFRAVERVDYEDQLLNVDETLINLKGNWTNDYCTLRYVADTTYTIASSTNNLRYRDLDGLHDLIESISSSLMSKDFGVWKLRKYGNNEEEDECIKSTWISLALCIQCLTGESENITGVAVQELAGKLATGKDAREMVVKGLEGRGLKVGYTTGNTDENGVLTEGLTFSMVSTRDEPTDLYNFSELMNLVWASGESEKISKSIWSGLCGNTMYTGEGEISRPINTSDYTTVPKLAQILESYAGLKDAIQDKLRDQSNETSKDAVTKYEINDSMSEFEKWSVVFMKAIAGQEVAQNSAEQYVRDETYNIENFFSWYNKESNKEKLSSEEVLRLQAFYNLAIEMSGMENSTKVDELLDGVGWDFDSKVKDLAGNSSFIPISRFGYNQATLRNNAVVGVKDTQYAYTNNSVLAAVMNNFLDVSCYYSAQVYGIKRENDLFVNNQDEEDLQYIKRNASLETILKPENLQNENGMQTGIAWSSVPSCMSRLRNLQMDKESYDAYKTLQYALMLANTYACSSFYSGLSAVEDEAGNVIYVNAAIEDYRQRWDGQDILDADNSIVYTYALAYTQILKGFEYLGVSAFSPQLEALLGYANWLKGIVDANDIDLSGRIDAVAEPLSNFFSVDTKTFSYYYNLGVALSASYIPMQTNMYDINSLTALDDVNFVEQFHYPYGFFRKALYIDTDTNAAVELYVSGKCGSKRVATLADLLKCEKDIVLYIDEKFYNVDTLADLRNFKYNKVLNTEDSDDLETEGFLEGVWSDIKETFTGRTVTADELVKTGGYRGYSENVRKDVTSRYVEGAEDSDGSGLVMSSAEIDAYMTGYSESESEKVYNEYTPLQGFAVVSAIYKKIQLYSTVSSQTNIASPVFVSSPDLAGVEGITQEYWNTLYNYLMLKNLPGNMSMDYKTTLDLDSPVYMDIYGNILTESGLVVIPAAANSTLQNATAYDVHTAGFLTLADNGYYDIPKGYNNAEKFAAGLNKETGTTIGDFILDPMGEVYQVAPKKINSVYYNFRDLPIGDTDVLVSLVNLHKQRLATNKSMKFDKRVYVITEVLRGAPLEWIDKQKEGLKTNGSLSKSGIYAAAKLEEISDMLLSTSNGNSLISFPNLAFMEHYEVVIMFAYKLLFALLVALMFIKIYMDVVQRRFGLRSITSFLFTVISFIIVLFFIPKLLDLSYYITNQALLQDESIYVATLNLEKRSDGKEIGVTSVRAPETNTVLYLKMDDVDIKWYTAAGKVLSVNSIDTMQEIYDNATRDSVMAQLDGTIVRGNAVYMDINTVFDATRLEYESKTKKLKNVTVQVPYASYITPYYAILDCLVERVNEYNKENDAFAFTTVVQSKGAVRTRGLVQGYFTSLQFMEQSQDPSTMFSVYGLDTTLVETSVFTPTDRARMLKSLWYSELSEDEVREKLVKLNSKAREFIADNYPLIGRVTDETFLKVMALYLALEHNKMFKCQYGSSLELFDIDTRDIMRLSMMNHASVLEGASKSFARFVYDEAGALGVVAMLLLVLVYFVMSLMKPIMVIIILVTMLVTLGIRKLFRHDQEHVVEGFVISMLLLCGTNILYAFMLKLSMMLPGIGLPPFIAIFVQIFVQLLYGGVMYLLLRVVLQDWKNLGYMTYYRKVQSMSVTSAVFQKLTFPAAVRAMQPADAQRYIESMQRAADRKKHVTKGVTGADILKRMKAREKKARKE